MGDHMVLQQNSSVKLWGWADGKKVTVTTSWNNRTYQASTDKDGTWLVKVDTPEGGILLIPLLSVTELRSLSRIY